MDYSRKNSAEVLEGCGCEGGCNHPSVKCPASKQGSCYSPNGNCCFDEIYRPEGRINFRLKYNCKKLVNQYVFRSLDRYASEIIYASEEYVEVLNKYEKYNLLSLGCGPLTELVAIDGYNKRREIQKKVNFFGIDVETTWKEIHQKVREFPLQDHMIENFNVRFGNVIEALDSDILDDKTFNLIVLNYIISSFIADGNKDKIPTLFASIANFIKKRKINNCIVIINDVNYPLRGIDFFEEIINVFNANEIDILSNKKKYFNYNNASPYGEAHNNNSTIFGHPIFGSNKCTSAQLLINCGVKNDY